MPLEPASAANDGRLHEVIASYLEADAAGRPPDRAELLRAHPDLADGLREFFADHDRMLRAAAPFRSGAETLATTPAQSAGHAASGTFGDYEILGEIARGGMGVVYRARQIRLNRVVALKMILAGQLASPGDVARFRAEAEAAANLDHPNIVPIYEVGHHDGQHYFSMKLIEGGGLKAHGPRPVGREDQRRVAELVAQVARAVHYAHQRGILHRDLKPANILLDAQGHPHVTDFGLAKRVAAAGAQPGANPLTQTGAAVGTPSYMAPEQAQGRAGLTTAADVYSVGAILYELLTGQPPFKADSSLDTLLLVLDKEPERPRKHNPHVEADMETICLKCLEKDPRRRYGSAEELARDLERWRAGDAIHARPSSAWERAVKWARRRPAASALAAVSSVSVLTLLVLAGFLWHNAEMRAETAQDLEKAQGELRAAQQQKQQAADETRKKLFELRQYEKQAEVERLKAHAAQETARRVLYAADMQLAHVAWQTDNVARQAGLMERHRPRPGQPDLRGFEWHYLDRLAHGDRLTLRWHPQRRPRGNQAEPDHLVVMAVSGDGKTLATASLAKPLVLWDRATGKQLRTLAAPAGAVVSLSFAEGDRELRLIAVRPADKEPEFDPQPLVPAAEGRAKPSLQSLSKVLLAQRLPVDGGKASPAAPLVPEKLDVTVNVLHGGEKESMAVSVTGSFAVKGYMVSPLVLAPSPDGKTLAVAAVLTPHPYRPPVSQQEAGVLLWDREKGQVRAVLKGHTTIVTSLAYSPDGKTLATGSLDRTVRLWEAATAKERAVLSGHSAVVLEVAFAPDGKTLASGAADGTVKLWDPGTGRPRGECKGHVDAIKSLAFTPDGREVVTASVDGTVKFWDPARAAGPRTIKDYGGAVRALAFSPDGATVTTVDQTGRLRVCDAATGRERLRGPDGGKLVRSACAALSPDAKTAAAGTLLGNVELLDGRTGKTTAGLKCEPGVAQALAFSPDGRRLAAGIGELEKKGQVKVWDVATRKEVLTLEGPADEVAGVAFSPDGRWLAAGSKDRTLRVWDAVTGKEKFVRKLSAPVTCVAFSPDGRRLAAAAVDTLTLHDLLTGQEMLTIEAYSHEPVALAFAPDGSRLATAGGAAATGRGGGVKVWDLVTGQELLSLGGPAEAVSAVAFSPDGTRLAAGVADEEQAFTLFRTVTGEVRIWDATPVRRAP